MGTGIEAWAVSMLVPGNLGTIIGITFLVLWLWSEKLSYDTKSPANGVLQRFSPLIKAIGEKLAPPAVTACIESFEASQTKTVTATQTTTVGATTGPVTTSLVDKVSPDPNG